MTDLRNMAVSGVAGGLFAVPWAPAAATPIRLVYPVESPSDDELMRGLAQGDGDAADRLVERHGAPIFAYLRRIARSRETAEDLFQETWIRVVRYCGGYRAGRGVRPWLYRIALNVARDHLRRETAARRGGAAWRVEMPDEVAAEPAELQPGEAAERAGALRRAVDTLPAKFREAVELRYFQDLPLEEVARVLRRPVGTVKSRLSRGLRMLEKELEGQL